MYARYKFDMKERGLDRPMRNSSIAGLTMPGELICWCESKTIPSPIHSAMGRQHLLDTLQGSKIACK